MSWSSSHSVGWTDALVSTFVGWVLWFQFSKQTVRWTDDPGDLGFGNSKGQGSTSFALDDLTHWQLSIRRLHLNQTETRQKFCFNTGWTDGASVQCVGALTGSLGSTAISAHVSDRMIRRFRRGNHWFIRRYYFSGNLFQRLASLARPINMTPMCLLSCLCHSEDLLQPRRGGECLLAIWDSLPLYWGALS
jgi:hypothetical protein